MAIDSPKKILEDSTVAGRINGQPIGVSQWATSAQVLALQEKIRSYKPNFQPKYCNKSHLHHMPNIKEFFNSPDHCRTTDFSFKLHLCGKTGCSISEKVGRTVNTPNVNIGKYNLCDEILHITTMPVPNTRPRPLSLS